MLDITTDLNAALALSQNRCFHFQEDRAKFVRTQENDPLTSTRPQLADGVDYYFDLPEILTIPDTAGMLGKNDTRDLCAFMIGYFPFSANKTSVREMSLAMLQLFHPGPNIYISNFRCY